MSGAEKHVAGARTPAHGGASLEAEIVVHRRGSFRLDISLRAAGGEIVAIMGPSGAGKSTLLAAIAGLVRLDEGSVRIGGEEVAAARPHRNVRPEHRGVALLGQEPRLFPHLSVRENVAFGPRSRRISRAAARASADEWLARVGLPGTGDRRPAELSGGQQQRVAIARALAASPRLLLLDEPLTSLDPETAGDIRAVLQAQLATARATALFVTHDAVDAAAIASRLIIVEGGRIAQQGPVREVFDAPATRFAATIAGVNRVVGVARGGVWWAPGAGAAERAGAASDAPEGVELAATDAASRDAAAHDGQPLAAVFRPAAVRLSLDEPAAGGEHLPGHAPSAPGTWVARIERLEQTPAGARVHTAEPRVAIDLPMSTVTDLRLSPGMPVRLHVDPADVRLQTGG